MLVGYDKGIDIPNVTPVMCKPTLGLYPTDSRVKQQFLTFCLDVNAVTVAA
jgi:hypothetical protein